MRGFIQRHPELLQDNAIILDSARFRACSKANLVPFYTFFGQLASDYCMEPELLFNIDETCINFTRRLHTKVILTRSQRNKFLLHPNRIVSSTLVLCIPARGRALDTTLLWPQKRPPKEFDSLPAMGIRVLFQESAYQTRATFEAMMLNYYLPAMLERREQLNKKNKPIFVVVDGHNSRLSIPTIYFCRQNNIHVIVLPAHTSSITQPLDCCSNGVLKAKFAKRLSEMVNSFSGTTKRQSEVIDEEKPIIKENMTSTDQEEGIPSPEDDQDQTTHRYPPLPSVIFGMRPSVEYLDSASSERQLLAAILPEAIEAATTFSVMQAGWKKSGLYPFNMDAVLSNLPVGEISEEKTRNNPSISGKLLTSPDVLLSIVKWKEGKLRKATSKQPEDKIQTEIDELQRRIVELEGIILSGLPRFTDASIQAQPEQTTAQSPLSTPPKEMPEPNPIEMQTSDMETPEIDADSSIDDLRIPDPTVAALLQGSPKKRILSEEYDDEIDKTLQGNQTSCETDPSSDSEVEKKESRSARHHKRPPSDMMLW